MQDSETGKRMEATWSNLKPGTIIYPNSDSTMRNSPDTVSSDSAKTSSKESHKLRWSLIVLFDIFVVWDIFFNGGHALEAMLYYLTSWVDLLPF